MAGDFGLRFYAGAPLTTHDGHNLGTLCAIDLIPRPRSEHETAILTDLAALVIDELELRLSAGNALTPPRNAPTCDAMDIHDARASPISGVLRAYAHGP